MNWEKDLKTRVEKKLGKPVDIKTNELLSKHTYFRIGGPAAAFVSPSTEEELNVLFEIAQDLGVRIFILGKGSNVLASDDGFDGLVIKTQYLHTEVLEENRQILAGAGAALTYLLRLAVEKGWGGFEFLTGIPGTVGGAIAMNAGTHLGEVSDHLCAIEVFDCGKKQKLEKSEISFSYRRNHFLKPGQIVLRSWWRYQPKDPAEIAKVVSETLSRRKATQPIDFPSCGSTFKNPEGTGMKAWEVIERLGLKGHQIGKAQFSEKHCNFILNLGGATSSDVTSLIEMAKQRAEKELRIKLEEEVQYLR